MIKIDGFMVVAKKRGANIQAYRPGVYNTYKIAEEKLKELPDANYHVAPVYLSKDYEFDVYEIVPDCIHI